MIPPVSPVAGGYRLMPKKPKPRLSKESAEIAWWRWGSHCAVPTCTEEATEWHHCFSQQQAMKWGMPELIDDPNNLIPCCSKHHAKHTAAMLRLPRSCCRYAEPLAVTDQMRDYLARYYGRKLG